MTWFALIRLGFVEFWADLEGMGVWPKQWLMQPNPTKTY